jgi:hypothetical protein
MIIIGQKVELPIIEKRQDYADYLTMSVLWLLLAAGRQRSRQEDTVQKL